MKNAQIRWRENPGVKIQRLDSPSMEMCFQQPMPCRQGFPVSHGSPERGAGSPKWFTRRYGVGHTSKSHWNHADLVLFPILVFCVYFLNSWCVCLTEISEEHAFPISGLRFISLEVTTLTCFCVLFSRYILCIYKCIHPHSYFKKLMQAYCTRLLYTLFISLNTSVSSTYYT
jgi:hypothetical protein